MFYSKPKMEFELTDRRMLCVVELTLSLTVSLILAPALLTAEYKNDPKVFAPCVTFVVTVETTKQND